MLVASVARAIAAPLDREQDIAGHDDHGDDPIEAGPYDWFIDLPWHHAPPSRLDPTAIERVLANAPPLSQVVAAAERAAGVADDPIPSWRRRSRLAALIPRVSVRTGNSESWRELDDPTISHAMMIGGTLAWRFDRLLFDPNEPRFAAHDVARRRERRRVARIAVRAYVAWIEAAAAADSDPHAALAVIEAAADLDALTDAWFSQTCANRPGSR